MKKIIYILLLSLVIQLCGCGMASKGKAEAEPLSHTEFIIGTVCTIKLYDKKDNSIIKEAFGRIDELEKKISSNKAYTEIDRINRSSGVEKIKVSKEALIVIKKGMEYGKLSGGSFDISIGPLVSLWHIGFNDAKIPSQEEIDSTLPYINYKDVEIDEPGETVFLKNKGMALDLGGIAKGFIADEVVKVLKDNGVTTAVIDLGGNIYVLGSKEGKPWKIGIQDPLNKRSETIGTLKSIDKSIVTSGINERFIERDGKRYHHILNPFDGYPYDNEIAGVTIVSDYSIDGDALSTTIFSKGLEEGLELAKRLQNIEAVFVTKDRRVFITDGLRDSLELINKDYILSN